MNAVDKEIEMLQAEKKTKPTSSYEVEVTSDDIIETSSENEVEFKEEKKTFRSRRRIHHKEKILLLKILVKLKKLKKKMEKVSTVNLFKKI